MSTWHSRLRLATATVAVAWCGSLLMAAGGAPAIPAAAAWLVRPLGPSAGSGASTESRHDVLDTPVLPGSIMKAVTLVAALESGLVDDRTARMCRRVVTIDGHTYTCAHPDLKRALTAAEALAHSCNDFFLALAPRLSREAINAVRGRAGLAPIASSTPLAAALVGLDGPRVRPRVLLDVMTRLAGVGPLPAVPMRPSSRRVLLEGLRGAADYGTASALRERGVSALAKTGTAPMPGGGAMGLVVALTPAAAPTRGVVVVAPGAAGVDAAALAADVLAADALAVPATPGQTTVRLGRTGRDGRARIETLAVEEYVAQVIAGEGDPRASATAWQALAIAARTYAIANRGRHAAEGFDMCDTTHCQVVRPATVDARRAATATAGRLLLHPGTGRVASVFHSAWCGGHPERPSEVWPGSIDDAGAAESDDACAGETGWSSELRAGDLEAAFTASGMRGSALRDLKIVARNRTGRVTRMRVEGWSPSELSGQEFRTIVGRRLGWQHVKSTLFDLQRTSVGYRITGRGFGHGAGLCVLGAGRRAARGESVDAILGFYFPGLTVGTVGALAPADDVRLALPGAEESERAALLALVRRSRDEIAGASGVVAPDVLRITVHPTVESFSRATGQPWFVAGATRGQAIDLLPTAMLRREGQLERVVRHEIAHALIDPVLADRALWVREGGAAYFASPVRPHARGVAAAAAACPTDAELRRPPSPAAQREAYARAAACFRRVVANGVAWREVR